MTKNRMKQLGPLLFVLGLLISSSGCVNNDILLPLPSSDPLNSRLTNSKPLPRSALRNLNGVYKVISTSQRGHTLFGDRIAVKQVDKRISFFCSNQYYFSLQTGIVDSLAILEGFWRAELGTQQGRAVMSLRSDFASHSLDSLVIDGTWTGDKPNDTNRFTLQYLNPLADSNDHFLIVDHHGGSNGAGLPYAENSLNGIRYTQYAGANAIELDVQITADHIPVLFHDANLSTNLVNGEFAVGPLVNYKLSELRALCTLTDGSPIPTLQEALDVIDTETDYKAVWLDIKDSSGVAPTLPIEIAFLAKEKAAGRRIDVWAGLPSSDHITAYLNDPLHTQAPSLCELTPADVSNVNAAVWGPRWTVGDLVNQAKGMRSQGRKVIYWTLDKPEFIIPFIKAGALDGILTDHPATVGYYFYTR
jgi:glycerophosphoryl diester phosphodiesterase